MTFYILHFLYSVIFITNTASSTQTTLSRQWLSHTRREYKDNVEQNIILLIH